MYSGYTRDRGEPGAYNNRSNRGGSYRDARQIPQSLHYDPTGSSEFQSGDSSRAYGKRLTVPSNPTHDMRDYSRSYPTDYNASQGYAERGRDRQLSARAYIGSQQYTSLRSPAKDTGEYHESRRPWSPYSRLPPHYDYPERRNHPLSPYHTSSASRSYPALQDSPKGLLHEYNNNTPLSRYTVKDDLPNQSTHVKRYTENDSSTFAYWDEQPPGRSIQRRSLSPVYPYPYSASATHKREDQHRPVSPASRTSSPEEGEDVEELRIPNNIAEIEVDQQLPPPKVPALPIHAANSLDDCLQVSQRQSCSDFAANEELCIPSIPSAETRLDKPLESVPPSNNSLVTETHKPQSFEETLFPPWIAHQDSQLESAVSNFSNIPCIDTPTRSPISDITNLCKSISDSVLQQRDAAVYLQENFARRDRLCQLRIEGAQSNYREINRQWRVHCEKMDRLQERHHRKPIPHHQQLAPSALSAMGILAPATPMSEVSGFPFEENTSFSGVAAATHNTAATPTFLSGRSSRRGGANGPLGDAVRSEAEFLEILASLENADMQDPRTRANRTAATVPSLLSNISHERYLHTFDDENSMIMDPQQFYGVTAQAASRYDTNIVTWSEDEVDLFCKRFAMYPKQFGKIASCLPDKTVQQCILFYYRSKRSIDFRRLSDRRNREGRKRKSKPNMGRSSMLLANLVKSKEDDDERIWVSTSIDHLHDTAAQHPAIRGGDVHGQGADHEISQESALGLNPIDRNKKESLDKEKRAMRGRELVADNGMTHIDGEETSSPDHSDESTEFTEEVPSKTRRKRARMTPKDDADGVSAIAVNQKGGRRKSGQSTSWSGAEKAEFIRSLALFGRDFGKLAEQLPGKTALQCRNFYANNQAKLGLGVIASNARLERLDAPAANSVSDRGVSHGPPTGYFTTTLNQHIVPEQTLTSRPRSGMQLRHMLNATENNQASPAANQDWFGDEDAVTDDEQGGRESSGFAFRDPAGRPIVPSETAYAEPLSRYHQLHRSFPERSYNLQQSMSSTSFKHSSDMFNNQHMALPGRFHFQSRYPLQYPPSYPPSNDHGPMR